MKLLFVCLAIIFGVVFIQIDNWSSQSFQLDETRVNKMVLCVQDHQLPCRWVGNYGSELGSPIFNYVAPLPFYIGGGLYFLHASISWATKLIYILPLAMILFGVSLMLWERRKNMVDILFCVVGVALGYYYLSDWVDVEVGVFWALAGMVLAVISFLGLLKKSNINHCLMLTISLSVLLLSLQAAVIVFGVMGLVGGILIWKKGQTKSIWFYIISLCLSVGIAAFYIFPMVIEGDLVRLNSLTGDYLPISVRSVPDKKPVPNISVLVGNASIFGYEEHSARFRFGIDNTDHAIVRLAIPYFPNWVIKSNGSVIKNYYDNNSLGLMTLIFGEGRFIVEGRLEDTPVRQIANIISLVCSLIVGLLMVTEMGRIRSGLKYYLKALHS